MGNTSSNRRVTVVNDDVVGVVQVSENVVRRLRGEPEKPPSQKFPEPAKESSVPRTFTPIEPYSSTLEQRQKYHHEFKKAEMSWQNRINELESQNRLLFETAKDKFAVLLDEIEEKHMQNSYAPVCPDKHQKVLQCYKENAKLPLNCSREVNEFFDCVEKVRMTALTK
ncbi:MICOS complex subunit MIC19-like [Uloborus diversus]|uniref:MICOS complex subunit MIC19-like n=1 Tax=Uloborus diversus TaxID=327109 RepID=UPI002408F915|nr:MICOS complex subunit MIC19-like [Uloborus diversus]